MKKLMTASLLGLFLTFAGAKDVRAELGEWLKVVFDTYACELICQNPQICTPGSVVWATLQFTREACTLNAATASAPIVYFGILDLNYARQRIGSCQGGFCW